MTKTSGAGGMTPLAERLNSAPAGGTPPALLEAVARATSEIARLVRRARIEDVVGAKGAVNVQGEQQQKLDVMADEIMIECLREVPAASVYVSEEQSEPVLLHPPHVDKEAGSTDAGGGCIVLADPLDGSSNIDVAIPVGTIFSVLKLPGDAAGLQGDALQRAVLQPGRRQAAAGYALYGSSTVLVLATASGVDMYVLDPEQGRYLLALSALRIPAQKKIYSLNEAYWNDFDPGLRSYLEFAHGAGYSARYVGSMVADVHRTLLKGGVFLYPATASAREGKLRLMYECNPMAYVVEQAGGAASTGTGAVLDEPPTALHQRAPVFLGSTHEVEQVLRRLRGKG